MLKGIFLPARVGNYFIFRKRILSVSLGKGTIRAATVTLRGAKVRLKQLIEVTIDSSTGVDQNDRVVTALREVASKAGNYDSLYLSIPSSHAIFKNLQLPFENDAKIEMVLGYELESSVPFKSSEMYYSFVKTDTSIPGSVLAAVVPSDYINNLVSLFEKADFPPIKRISLDALDIYGMYERIPSYKKSEKTTVILNVSNQFTTVIYLLNNKLSFVWNIPKGVGTVTKKIAQSLKEDQAEILKMVYRVGLEDGGNKKYLLAARKEFSALMEAIDFTVSSYQAQTAMQDENKTGPSKYLIVGRGSEVKGLEKLCEEVTGSKCEPLNLRALVRNGTLDLGGRKYLPAHFTEALGCAFPSKTTSDFNLYTTFVKNEERLQFKKQMGTMGLLSLLAVGIVFVRNYTNISNANDIKSRAEQELVSALRKNLDIPKNRRNLKDIVKTAEQKIGNEEDIWFSFSARTKVSFLEYLQELCMYIDAEAIGLDIKKMVITDSNITLEGQVQDFEALKALEEDLGYTGLFEKVPQLQDTKFSVKLPLKRVELHRKI